jgi:hypothetical protein
VRGILIDRDDMVAEMQFQVSSIFLGGVSTINRSCVRYLNRVITIEAQTLARGDEVTQGYLFGIVMQAVPPLESGLASTKSPALDVHSALD